MPSASTRSLAQRLLALEAARRPGGGVNHARVHEAVRVCDALQVSLTRFAGPQGFTSLLRRSVALARSEVPTLNDIHVAPDGRLEDLATIPDSNDAAVVVVAHLLELLVTFIGRPLTMRLVRDAWPDDPIEEFTMEGPR